LIPGNRSRSCTGGTGSLILHILALSALLAIALMPAGGCGAQRKEPAVRKTVTISRPSSTESRGKTYYVSTNGSNSNPGTRQKPWATPGYGSRKLHPGDTLEILGGRYTLSVYDEDIVMPPSGVEGSWTTVRGEKGNRPVLAGKDDLLAAVDLSGKSRVKLENIEITSDNGAPFRGGVEMSGGPVEHVVVQSLNIHHLDDIAINVADANDLQVLDCDITYYATGAIGGPAGERGGLRNLLVSNCRLSYGGHYYQGGSGPGPYDRPDGVGLEASEGPVEIANCTAEHNRGDGLDSKVANTHIHDCVVANNSCDGVKLWNHHSRVDNTLIYGTGDGEGGPSPWAGIVLGGGARTGSRFEVVNVTVHDNPSREAYPIYAEYDRNVAIVVVLKNTTISNGHGEVYMGDAVRLEADHCNFYRPGEEVQVYANGREYTSEEVVSGALGVGNISKNPLFIRPEWGENGDYHLEADSPLIGAGTTQGAPSKDLDGNTRGPGKSCDIGAYERKTVPG
jgi:hypothetical protein